MLSNLQIKNIDRTFHVLDQDHDGRIGWTDFEEAQAGILQQSRRPPDAPQVRNLHDAYLSVWQHIRDFADADHDDLVTEADYRAAYEQRHGFGAQLVAKWGRCAEATFDVLDTDGDGYLSQSEVTAIFLSAGLEPEIARMAFRSIDLDGDGRVDRDEWRQSVCSHFTATEDSMMKGQ
ncbi:hypothetical protein D5S17_12020 [Pseudonocardiaceae bacterium YIM PH 21723]|nr:hypothetical protein D5S17_12020 [Pseudonocardiaceae bacterium YIM PH 21723]